MTGNKKTAAVVVAAGQSRRMGFDKLFHQIDGQEVLLRSVLAMDSQPEIDEIVVVAGKNEEKVRALFTLHPAQNPLAVVRGGATRQHSVGAGVLACPDAEIIAIHDGARPFASAALISRVLAAAAKTGAAAAGVPVKDTIKRVEGGLVAATVPRSTLSAMQTPQAFGRAAYLAALAALPEESYETITDDCMVMELANLPVEIVPGEEENIKITTPADIAPGHAGVPGNVPGNFAAQTATGLRIGHGYDVHKLVEARPLIIGGVEIPFEKGLLGHSDADVLLHAVSDAILGAAALGDIGRHFPDTAAEYAGADSLVLLEKVAELAAGAGWRVVNLDATVLCQRPKLLPHIAAMRANIAGAVGAGVGAVSVKATTEEGLGFTGSGQGIAAHCVALLRRG